MNEPKPASGPLSGTDAPIVIGPPPSPEPDESEPPQAASTSAALATVTAAASLTFIRSPSSSVHRPTDPCSVRIVDSYDRIADTATVLQGRERCQATTLARSR